GHSLPSSLAHPPPHPKASHLSYALSSPHSPTSFSSLCPNARFSISAVTVTINGKIEQVNAKLQSPFSLRFFSPDAPQVGMTARSSLQEPLPWAGVKKDLHGPNPRIHTQRLGIGRARKDLACLP